MIGNCYCYAPICECYSADIAAIKPRAAQIPVAVVIEIWERLVEEAQKRGEYDNER